MFNSDSSLSSSNGILGGAPGILDPRVPWETKAYPRISPEGDATWEQYGPRPLLSACSRLQPKPWLNCHQFVRENSKLPLEATCPETN